MSGKSSHGAWPKELAPLQDALIHAMRFKGRQVRTAPPLRAVEVSHVQKRFGDGEGFIESLQAACAAGLVCGRSVNGKSWVWPVNKPAVDPMTIVKERMVEAVDAARKAYKFTPTAYTHGVLSATIKAHNALKTLR